MKWVQFGPIGHYEHDDDDSAAHEGCVAIEDALSHVLEHDWNAVVDAVQEHRARAWLTSGATLLEVLSTMSRNDKDGLRDAIRQTIAPVNDQKESYEPGLFAVATEVAAILESAGSAHAALCSVSDDLEWAADLRQLTRACRELLLMLPDADDQWDFQRRLAGPVSRINAARRALGPRELTVERSDRNTINFLSNPDPSSVPLHAYVAEWFSEYLITHRRFVDLGVCVECARLFVRGRRDNFYCSKTCQNRVAYKRKRIFEAGVLREVSVDPSQPAALQRGICVYHPRLGVGVIEAVWVRRYLVQVPRPNWLGRMQSFEMHEAQTMEEAIEELRKNEWFSVLDKAGAQWEEVSNAESLKVTARFLSTVRDFTYRDLFPKDETATRPAFYAIDDARQLAEFL